MSQLQLFGDGDDLGDRVPIPGRAPMPEQVARFPRFRYMGSKVRLLPWIHEVLATLTFDSALDAFAGTSSVGYLMKSMGKSVVSNDFLRFSSTIAQALVANSSSRLSDRDIELLEDPSRPAPSFIEETFSEIFFSPADLRYLDRIWGNLSRLSSKNKRAVALTALFRSCLKRQPRGVFTVSGDLRDYDDGRRDLRLDLRQHFREQVAVVNACVFSNGMRSSARTGDVFDVDTEGLDLVYLDPPYVPRSDDNCYMKRYHFLEGLSCYWKGLSIMHDTRVKKIAKPYTPFSYRKDAPAAFERLFEKFRRCIIVLSYSSNGFPDLDVLVQLMSRHKRSVVVHRKPHRYHFGTHAAVRRSLVEEYLIVGT